MSNDASALPKGGPDLFKVQVWIYALTKGAPRYLLLKMLPERGGFWQPVTGSVEPGEAIPNAALREATEETGIPFTAPLEGLNHQFQFEARGKRIEEHGFALRAPSPEVKVQLDPKEHNAYRWVEEEEASQLLRFDSNRDMLRILAKRLGSEVQQ